MSDCIEPSTIVGYRRCSEFGDWAKITAQPPRSLEVVTVIRSLRLSPISLAGSTNLEGYRLGYTAERAVSHTMQAIGLGLRGTIEIGPGFYVAGEVELGTATSYIPVRAVALDAEPIKAWQGGYGQAVAVFGTRGTIGETRVAVELAGGVLATPVTAKFADDPESGGAHTTMLSAVARPTAEARVRAARWLSPWISAGAFAGANLDGRGYMAGLQLGLHLRAFDGGR